MPGRFGSAVHESMRLFAPSGAILNSILLLGSKGSVPKLASAALLAPSPSESAVGEIPCAL